ncbi:hypothetical protein LINPERHAP1_LOCUS32845 [Linum perenne]
MVQPRLAVLLETVRDLSSKLSVLMLVLVLSRGPILELLLKA